MKHLGGLKTVKAVFYRHKRSLTAGLGKEARTQRKKQLKVLRRVALQFRPVKVQRVTDSSRHRVGALPLRVDYALNAAAGDDDVGFLDTLNVQKSRGSKSTSHGSGKKRVISVILLRAGDVVVVKAAQGEGVLYFLVQLKQDVREERSAEKSATSTSKGKTIKGKKVPQKTASTKTRVVVTPEKPLVRWFDPDGSTDEGDLAFVFDSVGSVNFEAIYCPVNYSNAVFSRAGELGSSATRLQRFTISEEQDAEFKTLINASCEQEVVAAMCGYKVGPVDRPGLDDSDTGSSSSHSSSDSSDGSDDEQELRVRRTTKTRTLKPNVRLMPMKAAAGQLGKDAHGRNKRKRQDL
jgi:hypothetical protein